MNEYLILIYVIVAIQSVVISFAINEIQKLKRKTKVDLDINDAPEYPATQTIKANKTKGLNARIEQEILSAITGKNAHKYMLSKSWSYTAIAKDIGIHRNTVKKHLETIRG